MTTVHQVKVLAAFAQSIDARAESPEYVYEVYDILGDFMSKIWGEKDRNVLMLRHANDALRGMFGMGAVKAWKQFRKSLPFMERITLDKDPSEEYKELWSSSERARARKTVQDILESAQ